jgi:hypothetical protein
MLEQILCDFLQEHGVHIERRTTLQALDIDRYAASEEGSHPVHVKIRRESDEGISQSFGGCY